MYVVWSGSGEKKNNYIEDDERQERKEKSRARMKYKKRVNREEIL